MKKKKLHQNSNCRSWEFGCCCFVFSFSPTWIKKLRHKMTATISSFLDSSCDFTTGIAVPVGTSEDSACYQHPFSSHFGVLRVRVRVCVHARAQGQPSGLWLWGTSSLLQNRCWEVSAPGHCHQASGLRGAEAWGPRACAVGSAKGCPGMVGCPVPWVWSASSGTNGSLSANRFLFLSTRNPPGWMF